jgi:hypothetical protein
MMMLMEDPSEGQGCAIFARTCELGIALGWENISLDPGCVEHRVDDDWWFAINPHGETTTQYVGAEGGPRPVKIPPYSIYFEFNGWPAGVCAWGGGVIAAGRLANEETLMAALDAAIEREGKPKA